MRGFVLLILLHSTSAVIHSLKYFSMASSGLTNVPEFVCAAVIDGVEMVHYDSNTSRAQPTQDWLRTVKEEDPDLWRWENEVLRHRQRNFKDHFEHLRQELNQTGGVHTFQGISSCEWNNDTGQVDGFMKYAYDLEDYIIFDTKTQTWVAAKQQALPTKDKWDIDPDFREIFSQECLKRLKKYLDYGRSSLLRTDPPSVFFLQRNTSSPISCLATGFYPNSTDLFWRKDGEELHQGVHIGDILPNHDGTFQRRAHLNLSSDEDWLRYQCVFQFSGVKEELVTTLDKAAIRRNTGSHGTWTNTIISISISIFLVVVLGVYFICRRASLGDSRTQLLGATYSSTPPAYNSVSTMIPDPPSCGNETCTVGISSDSGNPGSANMNHAKLSSSSSHCHSTIV